MKTPPSCYVEFYTKKHYNVLMRQLCNFPGCQNVSFTHKPIYKGKQYVYVYSKCYKHRISFVKRRAYWLRSYQKRKINEIGYWDKQKARIYANLKIKERKICEIMGCKRTGQKHHDNYLRYYDVQWLCSMHHAELHKKVCYNSQISLETAYESPR